MDERLERAVEVVYTDKEREQIDNDGYMDGMGFGDPPPPPPPPIEAPRESGITSVVDESAEFPGGKTA